MKELFQKLSKVFDFFKEKRTPGFEAPKAVEQPEAPRGKAEPKAGLEVSPAAKKEEARKTVRRSMARLSPKERARQNRETRAFNKLFARWRRWKERQGAKPEEITLKQFNKERAEHNKRRRKQKERAEKRREDLIKVQRYARWKEWKESQGADPSEINARQFKKEYREWQKREAALKKTYEAWREEDADRENVTYAMFKDAYKRWAKGGRRERRRGFDKEFIREFLAPTKEELLARKVREREEPREFAKHARKEEAKVKEFDRYARQLQKEVKEMDDLMKKAGDLAYIIKDLLEYRKGDFVSAKEYNASEGKIRELMRKISGIPKANEEDYKLFANRMRARLGKLKRGEKKVFARDLLDALYDLDAGRTGKAQEEFAALQRNLEKVDQENYVYFARAKDTVPAKYKAPAASAIAGLTEDELYELE